MIVYYWKVFFFAFSSGAFQIKHTLLLSPPMSDFSEINGDMPELCPDLVASPMSSRFEEVMLNGVLSVYMYLSIDHCNDIEVRI